MAVIGKGLEGHICPTILTSWWRHLKFYYIVVKGA